MAATIAVEIWKGGSDGSPGSEVTVTNVRFRTDDSPDTQDNTNPIPIPGAGFNYSYWAHVAMDIGGTFTEVTNIRHYSDGTIGWTLGTGGEVRRGNRDTGDHGAAGTDYDVATGTVGTTGYSIEDGANGHDFYNAQTTKTADISSDTDPGVVIDSSSITSAGNSKAVVLQVKVDTDATQGAQSAETFTWKYDEI